jgi:antirestriction protein ArdC
MKKTQSVDIYETVTNKIIALLEAGTIPWKKPWTGRGVPKNFLTRKPYRGINILLLNSLGYSQNYFLTFDQVKALGGSVKKDEKAEMVVFWKWVDVAKDDPTPPDEKKQQKPLLRYYKVFNIEQCTDIPLHMMPETAKKENYPIEACDRIIEHMPHKPQIKHEENEAFYHLIYDYINMPEIEYFVESENYYATYFHELIHSTGHKDRLNRKELTEPTRFGTEQYSIEELIAEIGACYLQSYAGIAPISLENSAAYIQWWLGKLKNDKRCIIFASGQAQKATDYILKLDGDKAEELSHSQKEIA